MHNKNDIAIIGMSGRFPEADNIHEYWENIKNGLDCLTRFSDDTTKQEQNEIYPKIYCRGIVRNIEKFDATFFEFTSREVELLDPQHRLFFECTWEILESAGYDPEIYDGAISVYASGGPSTYINEIDHKDHSPAEKMSTFIANAPDFLATRISYKFNLKGESIVVQTACSSSLTAVHMACQSLLNGNSDLAIAGGANIVVPQLLPYQYQQGMIYSPDGFCRPFDNEAQGTVESNGVGVVLLKRLDEAIRDGDYIYAVIKGSAINNDGNKKVGYAAPSVEGQAEVIATAIGISQVPADTIRYVETHGTGTRLGDAIEVQALKEAFKIFTDKKQFCALGSVKANVGHMVRASGIGGLIKTTLAVNKGIIPPLANYSNNNAELSIENSPFFIPDKLEKWDNSLGIRRAGVSSFGFGGTNVHLILEEPPKLTSNEELQPPYIITLSAKSEKDLNNIKNQIINYCEENKGESLSRITFTLNTRRRSFDYRWATVFSTMDELIRLLKEDEPSEKTNSWNFNRESSNCLKYNTELYDIYEKHSYEYICKQWMNGRFIDWKEFYKGVKINKIPLPTYPFDRKIHWLSNENNLNSLKNHAKGEREFIHCYSHAMGENTCLSSTLPDNIKILNEKEIERIVEEVFKEAIGDDEIDKEKDIYELGLDSLAFADIMSECEEGLGIKIPWEKAFESLIPESFSKLCKELYEEKYKTKNQV